MLTSKVYCRITTVLLVGMFPASCKKKTKPQQLDTVWLCYLLFICLCSFKKCCKRHKLEWFCHNSTPYCLSIPHFLMLKQCIVCVIVLLAFSKSSGIFPAWSHGLSIATRNEKETQTNRDKQHLETNSWEIVAVHHFEQFRKDECQDFYCITSNVFTMQAGSYNPKHLVLNMCIELVTGAKGSFWGNRKSYLHIFCFCCTKFSYCMSHQPLGGLNKISNRFSLETVGCRIRET